jgi:hypothetical protein
MHSVLDEESFISQSMLLYISGGRRNFMFARMIVINSRTEMATRLISKAAVKVISLNKRRRAYKEDIAKRSVA